MLPSAIVLLHHSPDQGFIGSIGKTKARIDRKPASARSLLCILRHNRIQQRHPLGRQEWREQPVQDSSADDSRGKSSFITWKRCQLYILKKPTDSERILETFSSFIIASLPSIRCTDQSTRGWKAPAEGQDLRRRVQ